MTKILSGTYLLTALLASAGAALAVPADAVYLNGKVFTADAGNTVVEAFAVTADRFAAVGSTSSAMKKLIGARTKVVDLQGHFVTPGLSDDHFHSEGGGSGIDLSHVRSLSELLTVVANAAASMPAGAIIESNSDWHEARLKDELTARNSIRPHRTIPWCWRGAGILTFSTMLP